jgi:hypothetical protein
MPVMTFTDLMVRNTLLRFSLSTLYGLGPVIGLRFQAKDASRLVTSAVYWYSAISA